MRKYNKIGKGWHSESERHSSARKYGKSIFFPAKNRRIADVISIKSPTEFKNSIKELKKNGLTTEEKRALVLARTRASLQLKRKNLSSKERKQMSAISKIKI